MGLRTWEEAVASVTEPLTVREAARRRHPLDGADAQALEAALSGAIADLERLRWGVVANAGRLSSKAQPRWAHVKEATGLGSTASRQLCVDAGFDPEEILP